MMKGKGFKVTRCRVMGLTDCFMFTDLILLTRGGRLFTKTKAQRVVNWVLLTLFLTRISVSCGIDLYANLTHNSFNIFFVSNASYIFFIMLFSLHFLYKRSQFRCFFRYTLKLLPKHQLAHMTALSKQNFRFFLLNFAAHVLCGVPLTSHSIRWSYVLHHTLFVVENTRTTRIIAGLMYVYEIVTMTMWIVVAFCLYNWAHVIKHRLCMCLLDTIQAILMNRETPMNENKRLAKTIEVIKLMRMIQGKFDDNFSFIAFLILSCNFFQAPGYLIGQFTENAGKDLESKMQTIGFSCLYLLVALILVTTVNKRHRELTDRVDELMDELSRCDPTSGGGNASTQAVAARIEKCVSRETAWGLFEIDNSLIGTYAGHFLTFSVMFFQIIPKDITLS
jgi:hypothetical protein